MEDGVEIINGQRFVRRFIAERTDPYFLQLQRGYQELEAARLAAEEADEAATRQREAKTSRDLWRQVGHETYEQTVEPTATGLRIHGLATKPSVTENNQATTSAKMQATLPVPLLSEHKDDGSHPIGQVYHLRKSPSGIYMRARLFADHIGARYAEELIRKGDVQCLSIAHAAGSKLLAVVDGTKFWGDWTLKEISICREGANDGCRFEIHRDGDDGRRFWQTATHKQIEPRLPYRGPWKADQEYLPGDMTSHQGGLWHSEITSRGVRPNESPAAWKLVVKRGAVEKMEKAHASTSL
ncbi:MAG: hypothetical protein E5V62_02985 [Mesorhizobium sp.]|uniref:hypothetical protein n=1 Tax=Mesorhizobium sp. TaxID=1871066 RepID=UPI000FD260A7|nr:hypothetical protein [Mesorhizobium sp.]RVD72931.1 hypothetical protein EN751_07550 [Mesorhizobium sp. M4A.F.Ca.ET.029.04.2.1]TIW37130.1 MAG: hypothetical protein E5V62_02985 [Mesorhizobium sp.]